MRSSKYGTTVRKYSNLHVRYENNDYNRNFCPKFRPIGRRQSAAVNRPPSIGRRQSAAVQIGSFLCFKAKNGRFKAKNGRFKAKNERF